MSILAQALAILANHLDLIEALVKTVASGASKDSIKQSLRQLEIEASDATMREELNLPPK